MKYLIRINLCNDMGIAKCFWQEHVHVSDISPAEEAQYIEIIRTLIPNRTFQFVMELSKTQKMSHDRGW